jgi:GAF domain-containing protein
MANKDNRPMRFLQQENKRLQEENEVLQAEVLALRRYVKALQSLQQTAQQFTPEKDILVLLDQTLLCALELLDANDASLALIDEETDELVFVLVHGTVSKVLPGYRFDSKLGIAGWVVTNLEPAIVNEVRDDSRFLSELDARFDFVTRSLVAVPLVARGKPLGVVEVLNKQSAEGFTADDANLLAILATISASALDYAASVPIGVD